MKWFGHLSNTHEQETMCALIDEHGMAGYGMYWIVKEKIAQNMGVDNMCSATFSIKNWASFAKVSSKKWEKFAKTLSELSLFEIEIIDKKMKISSQEMLDLRDEYTKKKLRKSGQYPDNIQTDDRTKSHINNNNIDINKKKELLLIRGTPLIHKTYPQSDNYQDLDKKNHFENLALFGNTYFNSSNSKAAWLFSDEQVDKIIKNLHDCTPLPRSSKELVDEIAFSVFLGSYRDTRINGSIDKAINSVISTIKKNKNWTLPKDYSQSTAELVCEQLILEKKQYA